MKTLRINAGSVERTALPWRAFDAAHMSPSPKVASNCQRSVPRNRGKDEEILAKEEVFRIQRVHDRREHPVQTGIRPREFEARASSSRS